MISKKAVFLICISILLSAILSVFVTRVCAQGNQPAADFTASPTFGLAPLNVTFTDLSTPYVNLTDWEWDFDNDATVDSTKQNPTYVYEQAGTYTVSLTVYDVNGDNDTETKTNYIIVTEPPNQPPVADANGPYVGTEGEAISFDGSGSYDLDGTITSYLWNFGDGTTSTDQNPAKAYEQDGTYTVTLTVTDDDTATDTDTTTATVADTAPTADFSYSPHPAPLTIDFTDESTSHDEIASWAWDFGDGETSTQQNPRHKFPDDGVFNVMLTVTDADGSTDKPPNQSP